MRRKSARAVVITADDLGIDPKRDAGIFAAHKAGALTQAGLMVGGPSAAEAARHASETGLALGLHLDLSEMPPLVPLERIPTLLNRDGGKLGKHGFRFAMALGTVDPKHIVLETEAQLDAFGSLTGYAARHVDGHQHAHWSTEMAEILGPLFRSRGIRSIRAVQPHRDKCTRLAYSKFGLGSTKELIALDPYAEAEELKAALMACPGGCSVEVMCHAGFAGSLGDDFNRSADRERELRLLQSLPWQPLTESGEIELMSFEELLERGKLC